MVERWSKASADGVLVMVVRQLEPVTEGRCLGWGWVLRQGLEWCREQALMSSVSQNCHCCSSQRPCADIKLWHAPFAFCTAEAISHSLTLSFCLSWFTNSVNLLSLFLALINQYFLKLQNKQTSWWITWTFFGKIKMFGILESFYCYTMNHHFANCSSIYGVILSIFLLMFAILLFF